MIREGNVEATPFCQSFTTAVINDIAALPTYASMCTPNAISGISSACSCFAPSTAVFLSNGTFPSGASNFSTATVTATTTVTVLTTLVTVTVTRSLAQPSIPVGCHEGNCLRAMIREGGIDATGFCQAFTTAMVSDPAALPTYASMCVPNAISGISSACSCFVPRPTGFSNGTTATQSILPSNSTASQTAPPAEEPTSSNSAPDIEAANLACNEDNCLRAMIREGNVDATPFCQTFTTAVITNEAALPMYASMCTPARIAGISSACSCYVPPAAAPTPASPGCNEDNCKAEPTFP